MKVINKWNGNIYTVLSMQAGIVKLRRSDNFEFEIQKNEFYFNYREVDE